MVNITIRNFADDITTCLRVCAVENHRSMQEEAWMIVRKAVCDGRCGLHNLVKITCEYSISHRGVELELPARGPMPVEYSPA